ncbi:LysM peptidoglycan-binding domain-containing protein [Cohnella sp.]|jgi:LysM repeat protein|uniref:LysM peptidoglycan-binding domain-containing protein n=1 Tax=Cohnella sp. TaxID=1883426 RepID=UPI00257A6874|nr:LysM peptidoglycan-binding domain-containing protein [Cohnella sp.]
MLFLILSFLILFAGFSFLRSFAVTDSVPAADGSEKTVIADAGDTLWSIAAEVKRDGMDTRQAVHRIMKRNGLASASIDSGQRLVIPADVLSG